ncbi:MAG: hypothetical protein GXP19_10035 [Gammaproteobacteria bacterium]|nr:hypothetical protein [Gammaproteobacteria bacterium]
MNKNGIFSSKIFGGTFRSKDELHSNVTWSSLSDQLDQLCQTIVFGLKLDADNNQQVLVASLYLKILSTFQAVQLLVEKEMLNESKTLVRSMMEAMFALVAIAKDPKIATRFIEDDHTQRLKLSISYAGLPLKLKKSLKPRLTKIINSSLNGLNKPSAKTHDITPLTVETLAQKAGLQEDYYSIFALLSGCNYLRVYELEQYWDGHSEGKSLLGLIHPDVKKNDAVLFTAIKTIFLSLNGVIQTFDIKVPKEHVALIKQFRNLANSSSKTTAKRQRPAQRVKRVQRA